MRYAGRLVTAVVAAITIVACAEEPAGPMSTPTAPPTPAATPTPEMVLLFSDDFDDVLRPEAWIAGAGCEPGAGPPGSPDVPSIAVVEGRVWAYNNCNYLETTQRFLPPLRIQAAIGSAIDQGQWYPCWNHYFELYMGPDARGPAGVVLFDAPEGDAIRLGPGCATPEGSVLDASGPNSGVARLTIHATSVSFEFVNTDGEEVQTGLGAFPGPDPVQPRPVRFWLAGPSYLDRVRIYGMP